MGTEQHEAPTQHGDQSRMYAMLAHLTALSGYIGIPFGNILGPLIVWLIKKDEYPLVDDQGKESLNFQITILVIDALALLAAGLVVLLTAVGSRTPIRHVPIAVIAIVAALAVVGLMKLLDIILVIVAAVKASDGVAFRYPIRIRFIR